MKAEQTSDAWPTGETFGGYIGLIQQLARSVVRGQVGGMAMDFVEDAPGLVWQRLQGVNPDPERGTFSSWCYAVLRNAWIDRLRRRRRGSEEVAQGGEAGHANALDLLPWPQQTEELAAVRAEHGQPLAPAALDRFVSKVPNAAHRVVITCICGMWRRVPEDRWSQWLAESGLEPPFPPPSFEQSERRERVAVLAEAIGVSQNAIIKVLSRNALRLYLQGEQST